MKYIQQENKKALHFVKDYFDCNVKRYIFGNNKYTLSLAREVLRSGLNIEAILDDWTSEKSLKIDNIEIPIMRFHQIATKNVRVVVVVALSKTNEALQSVKEKLDKRDFLTYFEFQKAANTLGYNLIEIEFFDDFVRNLSGLDSPSNWSDFRKDFINHKCEYEAIYERLEDRESKDTFETIINLRLSQQHSLLMKDFSYRPSEQYWEDFLDLDKVEIFFDIGAYQGETSEEFIKRSPNYKHIYFFEPDLENYNITKEIFKNNPKITGFHCGVGERDETLYFISDSTSGRFSRDYAPNAIETNVLSLDNLAEKGKILLNGGGYHIMIKLDIESSEEMAIQGMQGIIKNYRPILAVCAYHRFDDLRRIPQLIFDICDDYKLYFRHYTSGITESVMFFVPKEKIK